MGKLKEDPVPLGDSEIENVKGDDLVEVDLKNEHLWNGHRIKGQRLLPKRLAETLVEKDKELERKKGVLK